MISNFPNVLKLKSNYAAFRVNTKLCKDNYSKQKKWKKQVEYLKKCQNFPHPCQYRNRTAASYCSSIFIYLFIFE